MTGQTGLLKLLTSHTEPSWGRFPHAKTQKMSSPTLYVSTSTQIFLCLLQNFLRQGGYQAYEMLDMIAFKHRLECSSRSYDDANE